MVAKSSVAPKLDIFRVLGAANKKDTSFFGNLTPEEQKAFYPVLIMRWMSGTSRPDQLYLINECVNPYVFSLPHHKLLLWQLLTIANSGVNQKSTWIKAPGRNNTAKPISIKLIQKQYGYSSTRAAQALLLLTLDDIIEIGINQGYQVDELASIKKEWKPTQ